MVESASTTTLSQIAQGLTALAPFLSGPLAGWVMAYVMNQRYEAKDTQHIRALESHIQSQQEETRACNVRYQTLLDRIFRLEALLMTRQRGEDPLR